MKAHFKNQGISTLPVMSTVKVSEKKIEGTFDKPRGHFFNNAKRISSYSANLHESWKSRGDEATSLILLDFYLNTFFLD